MELDSQIAVAERRKKSTQVQQAWVCYGQRNTNDPEQNSNRNHMGGELTSEVPSQSIWGKQKSIADKKKQVTKENIHMHFHFLNEHWIKRLQTENKFLSKFTKPFLLIAITQTESLHIFMYNNHRVNCKKTYIYILTELSLYSSLLLI